MDIRASKYYAFNWSALSSEGSPAKYKNENIWNMSIWKNGILYITKENEHIYAIYNIQLQFEHKISFDYLYN